MRGAAGLRCCVRLRVSHTWGRGRGGTGTHVELEASGSWVCGCANVRGTHAVQGARGCWADPCRRTHHRPPGLMPPSGCSRARPRLGSLPAGPCPLLVRAAAPPPNSVPCCASPTPRPPGPPLTYTTTPRARPPPRMPATTAWHGAAVFACPSPLHRQARWARPYMVHVARRRGMLRAHRWGLARVGMRTCGRALACPHMCRHGRRGLVGACYPPPALECIRIHALACLRACVRMRACAGGRGEVCWLALPGLPVASATHARARARAQPSALVLSPMLHAGCSSSSKLSPHSHQPWRAACEPQHVPAPAPLAAVTMHA